MAVDSRGQAPGLLATTPSGPSETRGHPVSGLRPRIFDLGSEIFDLKALTPDAGRGTHDDKRVNEQTIQRANELTSQMIIKKIECLPFLIHQGIRLGQVIILSSQKLLLVQAGYLEKGFLVVHKVV